MAKVTHFAARTKVVAGCPIPSLNKALLQPLGNIHHFFQAHLVRHRIAAPVDPIAQLQQDVSGAFAKRLRHDAVVRAVAHENRHITIRRRRFVRD